MNQVEYIIGIAYVCKNSVVWRIYGKEIRGDANAVGLPCMRLHSNMINMNRIV
jgi:hypothetical protein